MTSKLEIANRIIDLNDEKDELTSKLSFLGKNICSKTRIYLINGNAELELYNYNEAFTAVNNALLDYIIARVIEIDKLLSKITIQDNE